MLTNTKLMLKKAQKGRYAVGAFNTSNLEFTKAIIKAAEDMKSPVIIQTSTSAIKYAGIEEIYSVVSTSAKKVNVPVAIHLDHGPDLIWVKNCLKHNYKSIMIDASSYSFKKNVEITRSVVKEASKFDASVEAELGALRGIEDDVVVKEKDVFFTNPIDAKRFVKLTKCDSLAVSIGTSHGPYKFKGKSKLDFKRLEEIRKVVDIPLVLHGASAIPKKTIIKAKKYGAVIGDTHGLSNADLKKAISLGICKVNIDSDLRLIFYAALREFIAKNPKVYDPRTILEHTNKAIYEFVCEKIRVLGSAGKA